MRIILCSSYVPFIRGGARNIVDWLNIELTKAGHQVNTVYLPHVDSPDTILSQMTAYRLMELQDACDKVICFRPPSHLIQHSNKVLWFIHHIRVFYDMWDSPYRWFSDNDKYKQTRNILHNADTMALKEAKQIFTNSGVVSKRLKKYNDIDSEILYPPLFNSSLFQSQEYGDEIVYICRMEDHKRQHLILEAMRFTKTNVILRLCGVSSNSEYTKRLEKIISESSARDRIIFENRWISEQEKIRCLAFALAAVYLPLDEDSYGYPSLEASHSSKAVITTSDSGGVPELIIDGFNGFVAEPDPKALAGVIDQLYLNRTLAKKMGENALSRIGNLNISWQYIVERLSE